MPVKKKSTNVKDYFVKLDDEYKETIRSNAYLGKKRLLNFQVNND